MKKLLAALAFGCCTWMAAAPVALAQERPLLAGPGETYLVPEEDRSKPISILGNGHLEVVLDDDLALVSFRSGETPDDIGFALPDISTTGETLSRVPSPALTNAHGSVSFTLVVSEKETLLKVQNNMDTPLAYVAVLFRGEGDDAQFKPTETCSVPAHRMTVESWPYEVDGLTVVRFLNPPSSDPTMCVDPTKDLDNPTWYSLDDQQ